MEQVRKNIKDTIEENAPKVVTVVAAGTTATQVGAAGWWAYLSTAGSAL